MVVATVVKVTRSTQVELFDECWTLTMVVELVALAVTCRWATPPLAVLAAFVLRGFVGRCRGGGGSRCGKMMPLSAPPSAWNSALVSTTSVTFLGDLVVGGDACGELGSSSGELPDGAVRSSESLDAPRAASRRASDPTVAVPSARVPGADLAVAQADDVRLI